MVSRRKISSVWQNFDLMKQEVMTRSSVSCVPKSSQIRLDVNLQGERATTSNSQQTNITTFVTSTHRRCDATDRVTPR